MGTQSLFGRILITRLGDFLGRKRNFDKTSVSSVELLTITRFWRLGEQ